MENTGRTPGLHSVESSGLVSEGTHIVNGEASSTAAAGPPAAAGWHEEGRWEGQGEDWEQTSVQTLTAVDRDELRHAVTTLCFVNFSTLCYANSAVTCFIWASLIRISFQFSDWGELSLSLWALLTQHAGKSICLDQYPWFQSLIQTWDERTGQADSVEFTHRLLRGVGNHSLLTRWERRVSTDQNIRVHDCGDPRMPLTLQLDPAACTSDTFQLDALLRHWHCELGMHAGLISAADLVCIHIDRFVLNSAGGLKKISTPIQFNLVVHLPVFCTGIQVNYCRYHVVAAFAHIGG